MDLSKIRQRDRLRLVNRLGGLYAFQVLYAFWPVADGDLRTIVVFAALSNLSLETGSDHLRPGRWDLDTRIPASAFGPVRISAVARLVDMPIETVSRCLRRLEQRGVCEKVVNGYVPSEAFMNSRVIEEVHLRNAFALTELLSELDMNDFF